jgi:uncharacterized phage protein gp47/JayE
MTRMFSVIPDSYDKSEGSFIYDAVVAVAIALEDGYLEMDEYLNKAFLDTSYDEYLDRITDQYGVYRKQATYATTILTIYGTDGTIIPSGTRFYSNDVYFSSDSDVTITNGTATVNVTCEVEGTLGNVPANTIVNIEGTISGITSVTNPNPVTNGTNIEDDETLRQRAYDVIQTPSASGNVQDYENWCTEVNGVGGATIIPLWNGNGSVKCVLVNSDMRAADSTLITSVQTSVESKRPIGATVSYVSATELLVNVAVDITLASGYDLTQVMTNITNDLTDYLKSIALTTSSISYAMIGSKILSSAGVLDYQNLTLNGTTSNVSVSNTQVAVVGTVNVT